MPTATSTSSKKILILGRPKSGKLSLVKALTSSLPSGLVHHSTSHAGLTHSITLKNEYFSTQAGIWIDEIPVDEETWLNEYLSEDAIPVFQNLAALILTVDMSTTTIKGDLEMVRRLNERGEEVEWDGTTLVVGKQSSVKSGVHDMSSLCDGYALEYVDMNASGKNEYGETLGLSRLFEVLHTCDWTSPAMEEIASDEFGSFQDGEIDFELNGFDHDDWKESGSERDVEYMESMMTMLINAREMGQEMDLDNRRRLARHTVEKLAKMS